MASMLNSAGQAFINHSLTALEHLTTASSLGVLYLSGTTRHQAVVVITWFIAIFDSNIDRSHGILRPRDPGAPLSLVTLLELIERKAAPGGCSSSTNTSFNAAISKWERVLSVGPKPVAPAPNEAPRQNGNVNICHEHNIVRSIQHVNRPLPVGCCN